VFETTHKKNGKTYSMEHFSKCVLCGFAYIIGLDVHLLQIKASPCEVTPTTHVTMHRIRSCLSYLSLN